MSPFAAINAAVHQGSSSFSRVPSEVSGEEVEPDGLVSAKSKDLAWQRGGQRSQRGSRARL